MNQQIDLSLWSRSPGAAIPLRRALELFDAAYRATGKSPRTIAWYRERLGYIFAHLDEALGREPVLGDFTPQAFRLFVLAAQARGKRQQQPSSSAPNQPLSSAYIHGFYRAARGFSSWLFSEEMLPINVMAVLPAPKVAQR